MGADKRVLILDNSPDLLELNRILLSAEGYEVLVSNYEGVSLTTIKKQAPRAILLDLAKDSAEPWALLTELRKEPETRSIGVMVTSASRALLERALGDRDLGVRCGLLIPFDVDDLYTCLDEAIKPEHDSQPVPLPTTVTNPVLRAIAQRMHKQRHQVMFRWVQHISTIPAFQRRGDLSLQDVIGEIATLLDWSITALSQHDQSLADLARTGECARAVRRHAERRIARGALLPDMVREFQILRVEISRALRNLSPLGGAGVTDGLLAHARLDEALDHLILLGVEVYEDMTADS